MAPLPSSNRTGGFPASGFPERFRRGMHMSPRLSLKQSQAEALQLGVERSPPEAERDVDSDVADGCVSDRTTYGSPGETPCADNHTRSIVPAPQHRLTTR